MIWLQSKDINIIIVIIIIIIINIIINFFYFGNHINIFYNIIKIQYQYY